MLSTSSRTARIAGAADDDDADDDAEDDADEEEEEEAEAEEEADDGDEDDGMSKRCTAAARARYANAGKRAMPSSLRAAAAASTKP